LGKQGLRKIYGVTLLLTLLLAFFAALLSAVLLSGWLAGPLRQLERATKAVASGDYRPLRADPKSTDELNVLVHSFNQMTSQLNEAREVATKSRTRLEESNLFLQQVLAHLSAGVLVFDARWWLTQSNAGAEKILGTSLEPYAGKPLEEFPLLSGCAQLLRGGLENRIEVQFQHEAVRTEGAQVTLLVSGSRLPGAVPRYVLVFDDIGEVLSAQRSKAFADMARRLAHEIKNPLTPIQLSAERLQRRLHDKLQPDDGDLLNRSTQVIVEQVSALKAMVDEFRNYARLPSASPERVDLDQLLSEMLLLYAADPRVKWESTHQPHWVLVDRSQLIQVVHNLVQNAQDAAGDKPDASVTLRLEEGQNKEGNPVIRLLVLDNGTGLPAEAKTRLFEPYFTSKTKGSGLGLAIVKKIVEENNARVSLQDRIDPASGANLGAVATIEFAKLQNASDNQDVKKKEPTANG
jgi:nitrogen fixation/metabolism regulation signal transduction histidine kinase